VLRAVANQHATARPDPWATSFSGVAGLVLCIAWWGILRSYRQLNTAKWKVVDDLEKDLEARPFTDEWALLRTATRGPHKLPRWMWRLGSYTELTKLEAIVPVLFAVVYVALISSGFFN